MGRGGADGGGHYERYPKRDLPAYTTEEHYFTIGFPQTLHQACIVKAGENLRNQNGLQASEFGYIISIDTTPSTEPAQRHHVLRTLVRWSKRGTPAATGNNKILWVRASLLLDHPDGVKLAKKYHSRNPEEAQPWGYQQLNRTCNRSSDSSSTLTEESLGVQQDERPPSKDSGTAEQKIQAIQCTEAP